MDTALLVIDVQVAFFEAEHSVYNAEEVLATIKNLIEKARKAHVPVIYIQHNTGSELDGTRMWHIHPQVAPAAGETVIQKYTPDSFYETPLHEELERGGITHLVITGFATEYCVDTTCRQAWSRGYQVTLVKDGHSTPGSEVVSAAHTIEHHSNVLGTFAATVKNSSEITF